MKPSKTEVKDFKRALKDRKKAGGVQKWSTAHLDALFGQDNNEKDFASYEAMKKAVVDYLQTGATIQ